MFNFYASNRLDKNKVLENDLFINFINNNKKVIGRIFEQIEEKAFYEFSPGELDFLKEFENKILKKELFPFIKNFNRFTSPSKEINIIKKYQNFLNNGFN